MLTIKEYEDLKSLLGDARTRPGVYLEPAQRSGLRKLLGDYDARARELAEHDATLAARAQA